MKITTYKNKAELTRYEQIRNKQGKQNKMEYLNQNT